MQQNDPPRRRVLLMAYFCNPHNGSEDAIGWNRAIQCAKHFDTWVITRGNDNAVQIRKFLKVNGQIPGVHFEFVDFRAWEKLMLKSRWLLWLVYNLWHRRAFRIARRLHREVHFNVAHQLTCISYREPGYLWTLGLPFVWGPVGGTENYPWRFLPEAGVVGAVSEALRNVVNSAQMRWSRRVNRAARRANALLMANSTAQEEFCRVHAVTGEVMLDIGIRRVARSPRENRTDAGPLRVLWSGVCVPRKALSMLLKALSHLPEDVPFELRVLGDGPMKRRWKRLAEQLGVDKHVKWMGWLPYEEAQCQYNWADLFAFTSLRDTTGTVVVEAMANGLPVVCLDHQGVHDVVTEQCGIKVPVTNPQQAITDFRDALVILARNAPLRTQKSAAAVERAGDYLWDRLGEQMRDVYQQVLGQDERREEETEPVARPAALHDLGSDHPARQNEFPQYVGGGRGFPCS